MKKFNKIMAITLGFAVVSSSMYCQPVATEEAPKNLIKIRPVKIVSATVDSAKLVAHIVKNTIKIARTIDNPEFKKAIAGMQPANIEKVIKQSDPKAAAKDLEAAYKNFIAIAPQIVSPTVLIVEDLVTIIGRYGEALINPEAQIKGKPANKTFNDGIESIIKIMKAIESLSIFTSQLPQPTTQEIGKQSKDIAAHEKKAQEKEAQDTAKEKAEPEPEIEAE